MDLTTFLKVEDKTECRRKDRRAIVKSAFFHFLLPPAVFEIHFADALFRVGEMRDKRHHHSIMRR
jgi:hypothetical protein